MNIHKQLTIFAIILFGAGTALAVPLTASWLEQRQALAAANTAQPTQQTVKLASRSEKKVIQGTPRHITVASLGIDVGVEDGFYDAKTGAWTLSEESAFYATPTSPINSDSGNTLIYGHNSDKLFKKLMNVQPGAEVVVTTDNGYTFTYLYVSNEAVKPTDTAALVYRGSKPRLTLQTCSGIWNETRQLFYFELTSYKKQ